MTLQTLNVALASPRQNGEGVVQQNGSNKGNNSGTTGVRQLILPKPYRLIPKNVQSLVECASYEVKHLHYLVEEACTATTGTEEEDALDDGFFLCDVNVVRRKLLAWREMFPRIKPFFAVKCHPDMMVTAVLGRYRQECGYDCASISEIKLAIASCLAGGDTPREAARRCVYANPQREASALKQALELGVGAMTFDGSEELQKIRHAYDKHLEHWNNGQQQQQNSNISIVAAITIPGAEKFTSPFAMPPQPPEMILRLLVPDDHSSVPLGEKFGAPPARVVDLTNECISSGLPLIGVSFHCGSGNHDPLSYRTAIEIAHEALTQMNVIMMARDLPPCTVLDIGGGYPGFDGAGADHDRFCHNTARSSHLPNCEEANNADAGGCGDSTHNVAAVVSPLLDELLPVDVDTDTEDSSSSSVVHVIAEPGRYFVEQAFALCSRIYSKRTETVVYTHDTHEDEDQKSKITVERHHYYIAQGVHGVFKDVLLCGETFVPLPLRMQYTENTEEFYQNSKRISSPDGDSEVLYPSTVHGPSGEVFDVVCPDRLLPNLAVGDWLVFDRMGAYTVSIAARSGNVPIRYVMGGGETVEQEILHVT
jgi:ornithine decarboxylase